MKSRTLLLMLMVLSLISAGLAQQATQAPATTPAAPPARDPGLYWTIETSMGSIHCKLFEKETPLTVKNLVGLAQGKMAYIDPRTRQKVAGKRFYDGLTFHRVIPRFMIQGGDPLGTGEGGPEGPGFPFRDEFVASIRFDAPGRLAMANAGPNTNASQFFIAEVPLPYLNDKHTIFGQCGDLEIVKAIARVPAKEDTPVKPVVIQRIVVERVGPAPAESSGGGAAKKTDKPVK